MQTIKIGLILGNEISMPDSLESLIKKLDLKLNYQGETYNFVTERVTIEPFDIRYQPSYNIVLERVSHWHKNPREWLKKVLFDGVYVINNPFTFQSMEKHTGFCAMAKLGINIPTTWLLPQKDVFLLTEEALNLYTKKFNLDEIANNIGYPLYMKPYNGGGWIGVTRINNPLDLHKTYNESGTRMMHLQKAIAYDKFVRSLSIGPQILALHYDPDAPLHLRYLIDHNYMPKEEEQKVFQIGKLINAFFGWEYNSFEMLIKDNELYPIDFCNPVPDSSLISLHYYFPWVVKSLIRWLVFCSVTKRQFRFNLNINHYLDIANEDLTFWQKMEKYQTLVQEYFEEEKFNYFCHTYLNHLDEAAYEFFLSDEFKKIIHKKVKKVFPPNEHDKFIAHYTELINLWAKDEQHHINEHG